MLKFTERVGDLELTYEGETVQDILDLRKALNPPCIVVKSEQPAEDVKQ